jgi:hypothetical protein
LVSGLWVVAAPACSAVYIRELVDVLKWVSTIQRLEKAMPKSRKFPSRWALALGLIFGSMIVSSGDEPSLGRLYKDHRYFELRDAVVATKDAPETEMEFYQGAVDAVFNRLESAINHLRIYLEGDGAAGRDLVLRKIEVHTQATHSITDIFDGTLGLDVLGPGSRMTFNFESMSFILEERK